MSRRAAVLAVIVGAVIVCLGIAAIYPPAALIVGGLSIASVGLLADYKR